VVWGGGITCTARRCIALERCRNILLRHGFARSASIRGFPPAWRTACTRCKRCACSASGGFSRRCACCGGRTHSGSAHVRAPGALARCYNTHRTRTGANSRRAGVRRHSTTRACGHLACNADGALWPDNEFMYWSFLLPEGGHKVPQCFKGKQSL